MNGVLFSDKVLDVPSFSSAEMDKTVAKTGQKNACQSQSTFSKACNQLKNIKRDEALVACAGFILGAVSTAWLLIGSGRAVLAGSPSYSLLNDDRSFSVSNGLFSNELSNTSTWFNVSPVSLATVSLNTVVQNTSSLFTSAVNSTPPGSLLNESKGILLVVPSIDLVTSEIAVNKATGVAEETLKKSDQVLGGGSADFPLKNVNNPKSDKIIASFRSIIVGKDVSEYNGLDWIVASATLGVLVSVLSKVASVCFSCLDCCDREPRLPGETPDPKVILEQALNKKVTHLSKPVDSVKLCPVEEAKALQEAIKPWWNEFSKHRDYINNHGHLLHFNDGKLRQTLSLGDSFEDALNMPPEKATADNIQTITNGIMAYINLESHIDPNNFYDAELKKPSLWESVSSKASTLKSVGMVVVSLVSSPKPTPRLLQDQVYIPLSEYAKWKQDCFPYAES